MTRIRWELYALRSSVGRTFFTKNMYYLNSTGFKFDNLLNFLKNNLAVMMQSVVAPAGCW